MMHDNEVARILESKFGLGEFPMVRRRVFSRLQRICQQRGVEALNVVSEVVVEAQSPNVRDKGRFFCFVVTRRLKELSMWEPLSEAEVARRKAVQPIRAKVAEDRVTETEKAQDFIDVIRKRAAEERLEATKKRLRERAASEGVEG